LICDGAKILAIVDAFEAMTHERGDRYHKRSILRAVTEINASDGQFSRAFIQPFNTISRELIAAAS
jgi:HD-GYP domain-containing protein (c-di-GMP phosphodiesterase class II)